MSARTRKPASAPHCHEISHDHPDYTRLLPRLKRVQGQVAGIERMISEGRYCVDILTQFRAAMAALRGVEVEIFQSHLKHCVKRALNDPKESERKIAELTDLLLKRSQI